MVISENQWNSIISKAYAEYMTGSVPNFGMVGKSSVPSCDALVLHAVLQSEDFENFISSWDDSEPEYAVAFNAAAELFFGKNLWVQAAAVCHGDLLLSAGLYRADNLRDILDAKFCLQIAFFIVKEALEVLSFPEGITFEEKQTLPEFMKMCDDIAVALGLLASETVEDEAAPGEAAPEEEVAEPTVQLPETIQVKLNSTLNMLHKYYDALFDSPFEGVLAASSSGISAYRFDTAGNMVGLDEYKSDGLTKISEQYDICGSASLQVRQGFINDYASLIKAWFNTGGKIQYIPQLHISTLSGILPDGSFTLKYAEHKASVTDNVTQMFTQLYLLVKGMPVAEQLQWFGLLRSLILNIIVVQKFDYSLMLTVASTYKTESFVATISSAESLLGFPAQTLTNQENSVLVSGEAEKAPNLSVVNICFNRDAYFKDINFAFKAVNDMAQRGKHSDFSKVLLGTAEDNSKVTINLDIANTFCVPIFAGSGSGKGVMTLATLGTAIATGHPFVYLDNKPDMAAMLWGIETSLNNQGQNARFLAVDSAILTGEDALAKPRYIPDRVKNNLYRGKAELQALVRKYETSISDITRFAVCSLVGKMTQLMLLLDDSSFSSDGRLVAVVDECNSISAYFASLLSVCKGAFEPAIGKCKKCLTSKDTSDEEKASARETMRVIGNMLSTLNLSAPQGTDTRAISAGNGALTDGVDAYLNTSGRMNNALLTICIGQEADTLSEIFPWTNCVHNPLSTPIFGTGNLTPKEIAQFGATSAGKLPTGIFIINHTTKCKSYLTLNENDYFREDHEYFGAIAPHKFTGDLAKGRNQQWIDSNLGTPEAPQEAVGFWGYVQLLARTNNLDLSAVISTMNMGYERALAALTRAGVMQARGYSCVEDWLYDLDPESYFTLAQLKNKELLSESSNVGAEAFDNAFSAVESPIPVGADASAATPSFTDVASFTGASEVEAMSEPLDSADSVDLFAGEEAGVSNPSEGMQQQPSAPLEFEPSQAHSEVAPPYTMVPQPQVVPPAPNQSFQEQLTSPGIGVVNSSQDTASCSAFERAITGSLNVGSALDSPFWVFHSGKRMSNMALRRELTKKIMASVKENYGGLDGITSFAVQNGVLIFNNIPYTPEIPADVLQYAPEAMKPDLANRKYACVFNYEALLSLKKLSLMNFDDLQMFDALFWSDTGIQPYHMEKVVKKWKNLARFVVNGKDMLAEYNDIAAHNEKGGSGDKASLLHDSMSASDVGKRFAHGFARLIGLKPPSSSGDMSYWEQLTTSKPANAIRSGVGWTAAIYGASLLFTLGNPWLLVAGAITAGSYWKNRKK